MRDSFAAMPSFVPPRARQPAMSVEDLAADVASVDDEYDTVTGPSDTSNKSAPTQKASKPSTTRKAAPELDFLPPDEPPIVVIPEADLTLKDFLVYRVQLLKATAEKHRHAADRAKEKQIYFAQALNAAGAENFEERQAQISAEDEIERVLLRIERLGRPNRRFVPPPMPLPEIVVERAPKPAKKKERHGPIELPTLGVPFVEPFSESPIPSPPLPPRRRDHIEEVPVLELPPERFPSPPLEPPTRNPYCGPMPAFYNKNEFGMFPDPSGSRHSETPFGKSRAGRTTKGVDIFGAGNVDVFGFDQYMPPLASKPSMPPHVPLATGPRRHQNRDRSSSTSSVSSASSSSDSEHEPVFTPQPRPWARRNRRTVPYRHSTFRPISPEHGPNRNWRPRGRHDSDTDEVNWWDIPEVKRQPRRRRGKKDDWSRSRSVPSKNVRFRPEKPDFTEW